MHWGTVNGAGINGEEAERAWNSYIAQKVLLAHSPVAIFMQQGLNIQNISLIVP